MLTLSESSDVEVTELLSQLKEHLFCKSSDYDSDKIRKIESEIATILLAENMGKLHDL